MAAKKQAKSAKRPSAKSSRKSLAKKAPAKQDESRQIVHGFVSHTELASNDPPATKELCVNVFGWKFGDPVAMPTGPYHMWRHEHGTGGGIRDLSGPEAPGAVPYVEVKDIKKAFAKALAGGATQMMPLTDVGDGGWIAVVQAPGGCAIGLYGR